MTKFFLGGIILVTFSFSSCTYVEVEPTVAPASDSVISYSKTIAPLVNLQCSSANGCHESGSQDGDFTTYDGVKEKAADGSLLKRVVTLKDMPQIGSGMTLTDEERNYFALWIKQQFPNN